MIDPLVMGIKMAAVGAGLGVLFFGGLWLTLKRLPVTNRPYLLTLSSVIARMVVVLLGIWYFSHGDPVGVAAGLGGFMAVQLLATHIGSANVEPSEKKMP